MLSYQRNVIRFCLCVGICLGLSVSLKAATRVVQVSGPVSYLFTPSVLNAELGDTVTWTNTSSTTHDISQGTFAGGTVTNNPYWTRINLAAFTGRGSVTFSNLGAFPYVCNQHVFITPQPFGNPTQTGLVNVTTFNFPPSVTLDEPQGGSTLLAPATVTVSATATDSDGSITNLQLLVGSNIVAEVSGTTLQATVPGLPGGNYSFSARAFDNLGKSATSTVAVVVQHRVDYLPDLTYAPAVLRIKPGESVLFTNAGGAHTVSGTGAEPFCGSAFVPIEFCRATLNTVGSYPYRCVFHSASQAAGMTGTVSVATFNRPPLVELLSPASNMTVPFGNNITLQARALDVDGSLTTVQFVNTTTNATSTNTTVIFADTVFPYAYTMTNPAVGVYNLAVRAADNSGFRSTSAPVVVTVISAEIRLTTPTVVGGGFRFNYNSTPGASYVVEGSSTTTGPGPFEPLATNVATTNVVTFTDPNADRVLRTYRVFKRP
jgi:plastocyanin